MHYCRKSTGKLYLDHSVPTYADLYRLYCEKWAEHNKMPLSRLVLMNKFHAVNLTLSSSRKDQCNTCVAHENNLISDDKYSEHLPRKEQAREEKQKDKLIATDCATEGYMGPKTLVITMDLQAHLHFRHWLCITSRSWLSTTLLYTIGNSWHAMLEYLWHEGQGGPTSNELSSCITDCLQQNLQYEENILCSDGCGYRRTEIAFCQTYSYPSPKRTTKPWRRSIWSGDTCRWRSRLKRLS